MKKITLLFIIPALILFASNIFSQDVWQENSFEDFRDGSFLDAGSNLYVSANGRIQMITRWDFNNDGNLDILLASGHGHTEKENTYIYLNNGEDIVARSRIELPAAGSYDGLIADLNKDGFNDLAVVHNSDSHVKRVPIWIYFGSNKGFLVENRIELPSEAGTAIAIGDFNNDTWLDIAVGCQYVDEDFDHPISMIYWNSANGFDAKNRLPLFFNKRGVVALASGDIDKDGIDDLVASTTEKTFLMLSSKKSFTNLENVGTIEIEGRKVAIGDFNDDSNPDLVMVTNKTVLVFKGNGTGEFDLENAVKLKISHPSDVVFSDVDQDGFDDVVVSNFATSGGATWADSYLFYSDGKDFSSRETLAIPTLGASSVSCGDLNNDGYPEIVFGFERSTNQNNIYSYVYWNDKGTFRFENHTQLPTQGTLSNTIGDVNNDGLPDVIFFNDEGYFRDGPSTSHIYWGDGTRNFSVTRCREFLTHQVFGFGHADLDDDGNVDIIFANKNFEKGISHLQAGLLIQWGDNGDFINPTPLTMTYGYGGVRIADINKDGYLDLLAAGQCLDLDDPDRHGFPIFWGSEKGFNFRNRSLLHYTADKFRAPLLMDLNNDGWLDITGQVGEYGGEA